SPPGGGAFDPNLLAAFAQLFAKGGFGGAAPSSHTPPGKTKPAPLYQQEATPAQSYFDPCLDCVCPCPRAAMRLPAYSEVRQMAEHWRRY
ncbi:MAG: hypothetical protein RRY35_06765, partial [Clostridiales bacterium]